MIERFAIALACSLVTAAHAAPKSRTSKATAKASTDHEPLLVLHSGVGKPSDRDVARVREALRPRFPGREISSPSGQQLETRLAEVAKRRALSDGRRLAREGWLALNHFSLARGRRLLRQSLRAFAMAQPNPAACREAARPFRHLAYAFWQSGDRSRPVALLAAADRLSSTAIDARLYPPPFVAFARKVSSPPPVARSVTSRPGGVLIQDCKQVGSTPHSIEVHGATLVKVSAAGFRSWATVLEGTARWTLDEVALTAEPRSTRIARLMKHDGVVYWRERGDKLQLCRPSGGSLRSCNWSTIIAIDAGGVQQRRERRWSGRRIAMWSLAGLSVAALAVGTTFGVLARNAASELEQDAETNRFYNEDLDSRRRQSGYVAYTSWGVGAAAAVATVVLWLWSDESDSRRDVRPPPQGAGARSLRLTLTGVSFSW